jgi:hypothetical protein
MRGLVWSGEAFPIREDDRQLLVDRYILPKWRGGVGPVHLSRWRDQTKGLQGFSWWWRLWPSPALLRFRLAAWVSLGIPISFLGAVWLGVVVNDSLVLVGRGNRYRDKHDLGSAVREAAVARFRPVLLTSLTTSSAFCPFFWRGASRPAS